MCRYLGNDFLLGKLFEKVAERKIQSLTFNKLYDILYYTSVKLNQSEDTLLLVTRNGILHFAEIYQDFIEIDDSEEEITIKNTVKINQFSAIFDKDENLEKVISDAIEQVYAA